MKSHNYTECNKLCLCFIITVAPSIQGIYTRRGGKDPKFRSFKHPSSYVKLPQIGELNRFMGYRDLLTVQSSKSNLNLVEKQKILK